MAAVLGDWERKADDMEASLPMIGLYPAAGLIRRARRIGELSQRQMARLARVAPSTVGKVESGAMKLSLDHMQRLLATAGLYLIVVDPNGRVIVPMRECEEGRDTILDPRPGEWWADQYGLARPPETFYRDREYRDMQRRRSQWQVRVAKYRAAPAPPDPDAIRARAAKQAELRRKAKLGIVDGEPVAPDAYDPYE